MCHGSNLARERRHYGFVRSDGRYLARARGTVTVTVATAAPAQTRTGVVVRWEIGGVGEVPSPTMSSSNSEDSSEEDTRSIRKLKFHLGVDDPEKFWQQLEFPVADGRAGYDNRSLLGKLIKCLRKHPVKAKPLLLWKERN